MTNLVTSGRKKRCITSGQFLGFCFGAIFAIVAIQFNTMMTTMPRWNESFLGDHPQTKANHDPPPPAAATSAAQLLPSICPSATKLFDPDSLKSMIEKAKDFHQRGGNLVSIENYLNGELQNTLDRLDMKFEFQPIAKHQPNAVAAAAAKSGTTANSAAIDDLHNYYQTHTIPRGGYGQPLPGTWTGPNSGKKGANFGSRWINVIEPDTSKRFKVAIGQVGPECLEEVRFTENSLVEKIFCVPPNHINQQQQQQQPQEVSSECHMFSIGSNDQWGFEVDVHKKLPDCVTHTFDCTLKNNQPRKKPKSDQIRFYPYCIGGGTVTDQNNNEDKGNQKKERFLPYHELWKRTNMTQPPQLLKIDVEGFEFGVIPSMLRDSPSDIWPEQIMMEVHWATRMVEVPSMLRTRQASEISLLFGQLFTHGGYLPVKSKYFDPHCSTCLEVLLVRVLCHE